MQELQLKAISHPVRYTSWKKVRWSVVSLRHRQRFRHTIFQGSQANTDRGAPPCQAWPRVSVSRRYDQLGRQIQSITKYSGLVIMYRNYSFSYLVWKSKWKQTHISSKFLTFYLFYPRRQREWQLYQLCFPTIVHAALWVLLRLWQRCYLGTWAQPSPILGQSVPRR